MDSTHFMDIIHELRRGARRKGDDGPRVKPGREVRDGVLCYDGTGPSGYTGRCSAPRSEPRSPDKKGPNTLIGGRSTEQVRKAAADATKRLKKARS